MTCDTLKSLHAVDMMVNSRITLGTSRAAKSNTRAAQEAETTRSPVICRWWWQWGPWGLSCLWISGVGQVMPEFCQGLKVFTESWQIWPAKKRFWLQFPRGKQAIMRNDSFFLLLFCIYMFTYTKAFCYVHWVHFQVQALPDFSFLLFKSVQLRKGIRETCLSC